MTIMILWAGTAADAKYNGGTGEPNDPYRIATAAELNEIGKHPEDWDKNFILINDLDVAGYCARYISGGCFGPPFNIIGRYFGPNDPNNKPFTGVFEGNGHTVHNFAWCSKNMDCIGLFGWVGTGGQIKNLGMENISVSAAVYGPGDNIGGLSGSNDGTITNCYSTGDVSGDQDVGGLVGYNSGMITNCYSTASAGGTSSAGGLVGENSGIVSTSNSTGFARGGYYVGGLVGYNLGSISQCYSDANVYAGAFDGGGLVGYNFGGNNIDKSYSTGRVDGRAPLGGLVAEGGPCIKSFWDVNTSGQSTSACGIGKTTAEMKTKSTFTDAGWDFVGETANGTEDYWRMCVDGVRYPLLSWQFIGDFACPDGVDIFDLQFFTERWLTACSQNNNFCNCTDMNYDELVNFFDFAIFASHWLEGM